MAVQSNGAIVLTGSACPHPQRFAAVRVLPDGTPDAAFGDNGMLIVEPGFSDEVLLTGDSNEDRRILIGGSVGETDLDESIDFALLGLADDGSVDETFGDGGMVVTDFGDGSPGRTEILAALALTPNGKLLAGGSIQLLPNLQQPWQYSYDFLVAAYDAEGALDVSFGDAGTVRIDFGSDTDELVEVLPRPNGNIVVVGGSLPLQWERRIALAHLGPDGAPVDDEYQTVTALEEAGINPRGATLDNQERLLVTGFVRYEGGGFDAFVARYVLDATR